MRIYPELKGTYLIVRYLPICLSVARMLIEHYDKPEYTDKVIVVNTMDEIQDMRNLYPNKYIIYYQQEHLRLDTSFRYDCLRRITQFDEIWDLDWNNCTYYRIEHRNKVKFMPMRYSTQYEDKKIVTNKNPKFDILFCGVLTPHRFELFNNLSYKFEFNKTMIIWGKTLDEVPELLMDCKLCLNLHQLDSEANNQEQIRIYELLMMGKSVITEESLINYFGNLVTEFNFNNFIPKLNMAQALDRSEEYKAMTYSDEAYEKYRKDIMNNSITVGGPISY